MTVQGETALLVDVISDNGRAVLRLAGELDMSGTKKVLDAGMRLLARRDLDAVIVIDVADLVFCDSSGMHVLHQLQRDAAALGRSFALRSPRPIVLRILELTGMAEVIPVLPRVGTVQS